MRTPVPAPYDESIINLASSSCSGASAMSSSFRTQDYVAEKMGKTMAESPAATMADVYKDLDPRRPCI